MAKSRASSILAMLLLIFLCLLWHADALAGGITIGTGASITLSGTPEITTVDLTISGTLSADRGTVNISGDWTRAGTFNQDRSTVAVVGSGTTTITGSNTFFRFSCTAQSKAITFIADTTQTIESTLTFTGASGARIVLRSSVSGTQWKIDPQAQVSVNFVDVRDSNNLDVSAIAPSNSLDSGNNQNWEFGSLSISGNQTVIAGTEAGPYTLDITFKNSNTANRDITVDLGSDSTGVFEFRATSGGPAVTSVVIPAGSTSTVVFYVDNAEGAPTISASTLSYISGSLKLTVSVVTFQVTAVSPQISGSGFRLTITAVKAGGGVFTGYSGTANLTVNYISPSAGSGTLGTTSTSAFVNGRAVMTNQTFSDCGTITIMATDSVDPTIIGTSSNILFVPFDFTVVASDLDTAAVGNADASHIVSKPFTLTTTARNAAAAVCPNYKGNTTLSINYVSPSTDQSGMLGIATLTSLNWTGGVAALTNQTYNKWGTISIKASDDTVTTQIGTSQETFFIPKDFLITLSAFPAARDFYYTNENFSTTVTVRDFNNQTIANYQGTIMFSGSGLNLPANYTFTLADAGVHTFAALNGSGQTQTALSATDTGNSAITGTSSGITVKAGKIKVFSASGPVGPVSIDVKVLDSEGSVITSDDSTTFTVTLSEFIPDNSASSPATETAVQFTDGTASITVTDDSAEVVTVTPASTPVLTVEAGTVTFGTVSGAGVGIQLWREIENVE